MKLKSIIAVAVAMASAVTVAGGWNDESWIGDGRPAPTNDAAYYDVRPAPEFRSRFVCPKGMEKTVLRIAAAGYYRLSVNGMPPDESTGLSLMPLWSPYGKTMYSDEYALAVRRGATAPQTKSGRRRDATASQTKSGRRRVEDAPPYHVLLRPWPETNEALNRPLAVLTATAHWYEFVRLTAEFAGRLGKTDDEADFREIAKKIRGAFAASFVKDDGTVGDGSQSAQATGFYLGLVPEHIRMMSFAKLVESVESKGCAPTTGIFSTRYMLLALSENGRLDLARKIALHRGFPGWMHMLDRGATTLWETWRESDNIFSNCHPMFGSVDEWIIRFAASCAE